MQSGEAQQRLNAIAPFCLGEYVISQKSYLDVDILPNSVIYCDPPYKDTWGYNCEEFNHEEFYDWCEVQSQPVLISEYSMPDNRFVPIAEWERVSTASRYDNSLKRIEKIFVPKSQLEMFPHLFPNL